MFFDVSGTLSDSFSITLRYLSKRVLRTSFNVSRETLRGKLFTPNKWVFTTFRSVSVAFPNFWPQIFDWFLETAFYGSTEFKWRKKIYFQKVLTLWKLSDYQRKFFEPCKKSFKNLRPGCQNCVLNLDFYTLGKKWFFFKREWHYLFFLKFSGRSSQKFGRKILAGFQNCILSVQKNILVKNFLAKKKRNMWFFLNPNRWMFFRTPAWNLLAGLSKLQSTCWEEEFQWKNFAFKKKLLTYFRTLSENFYGHETSFFRQYFSEVCFSFPEEHLHTRKFFEMGIVSFIMFRS